MFRFSIYCVLLCVVLALFVLVSVPVAFADSFTVDTNDDTRDATPGDGVCADAGNNCSLRAAIMETNALSGDDTIVLPAGVYVITLIGAGEDGGVRGDLDVITGSLVISGTGAANSIIDGNQLDRVLHVQSDAVVQINGVMLINGKTPDGGVPYEASDPGGAIYNLGELTLVDSIIENNTTGDGGYGGTSQGGDSGTGGGIYNEGILSLVNIQIISNTTGNGGGCYADMYDEGICGDAGAGGGIYNGGILSLVNTQIAGGVTGNGGDGDYEGICGDAGAGGGIYNGGLLTLTHSAVINSVAGHGGEGPAHGTIVGDGGDGGGIYNQDRLVLVESTLNGNIAGDGGYAPHSAGGDGGDGGGIYNQGVLTITGSTLNYNTAGQNGAEFGPDGAGGGICNAGSLVLDHSTLSYNATRDGLYSRGGPGGGIYNQGTLALAHTAIISNVTGNGGNYGSGGNVYAGGSGGGVYNNGTMTLISGTVSGNVTGHGGGGGWGAKGGSGGGIYNGGVCTITGSLVDNNTNGVGGSGGEVGGPGGDGGGFYNEGQLTLVRVTISGNTAGNGDSNPWNVGGNGGKGGGIYNKGGLTLEASALFNNTTGNGGDGGGGGPFGGNGGDGGSGGGIYNEGGLTLEESALANNTTGNGGQSTGDGNGGNGGNGGGIYNENTSTTFSVAHSVVSGNVSGYGGSGDIEGSDGDGGGIYNRGVLAQLVNGTLSGNQAAGSGGGLANGDGAELDVNNMTIVANIADNDAYGNGDGGGIYQYTGTVNIKNSIIAGNDDLSGSGAEDCGGAINSQGYNLTGEGTGCPNTGAGDSTVDPEDVFILVLGPLQDNGGRTPTHALLLGSPAVDNGNPAPPGSGGNACQSDDQRGVSRPCGGGCDIGAYELASGLVLNKFGDPSILAPGDPLTYTLVYVNYSLETATGVLITDVLPITLTQVNVAYSGALVTPVGGIQFAWQVATLAPGAGGCITLTGIVSPAVGGVFNLTNQAIITTTDPGYVDEYLEDNVSCVTTLVDGEPPLPPSLVSPLVGAIINDTTPLLVWEASPSSDLAGYWLNWSGALLDVEDVTQHTVIVAVDGAYTWTVAAYDTVHNTSLYTDVWVFVVDSTPPEIVDTAPGAGAVGVAIDALAIITFSEPIVTQTLDYTVSPDPGGWSATWNSEGTVVTLDHNPLAYETAHTITVVAAEDPAGNPLLDAPLAWSFSTQAAPCTEVSGITLTQVTTGTIYPNDVVEFQADVAPADADPPYRYRVSVDGQAWDAMTATIAPLVFTDTFATTGTHTVAIAVWNCDLGEAEAVTSALDVQVYPEGMCVGLESVAIEGETSGYPGVYTFTTDYQPLGATLPISYLWDNGDDTATLVRSLDPGVHILVVTATNCLQGAYLQDTDAQVMDTHTIVISEEPVCNEVTAITLSYTNTGTIYAGDVVYFQADLSPNEADPDYNYIVSIDGVPGAAMSSGTEPLAFEHTFDISGAYSVEIMVWNCDMTLPNVVTATLDVDIYEPGVCVGLESIEILGAATGETNVGYTFDTDYTPAGASMPIEYFWDNGDTTYSSTRSFDVTGTFTLTVVANNCVDAEVTDEHVIVISGEPITCTEVNGVVLSLNTAGEIDTSTLAELNADIMPDDFSGPYSYTVDYGDGTAADSGASSDDPLVLSHTFAITGDLTVTIEVWNCQMTGRQMDNLQVTIAPLFYKLYLPVVVKND